MMNGGRRLHARNLLVGKECARLEGDTTISGAIVRRARGPTGNRRTFPAPLDDSPGLTAEGMREEEVVGAGRRQGMRREREEWEVDTATHSPRTFLSPSPSLSVCRGRASVGVLLSSEHALLPLSGLASSFFLPLRRRLHKAKSVIFFICSASFLVLLVEKGMEEEFTRGEGRPRLLDLISNGRDWRSYAAAEEKKLELRLGLPGGEDWSAGQEKREHPIESALSLGHISKVPKSTNVNASSGTKRRFLVHVEPKTEGVLIDNMSLILYPGSAEQQSLEGKGCGPHPPHASSTKNAAVAHTASQSRTSWLVICYYRRNNSFVTNSLCLYESRVAATPVVGWPPVRSFRMNLAGTAKASAESNNGSSEAAKKIENDKKSLFVKINMDGIPIGRKVDLKAFDSYDKLSLAVDELFRGLMAAQADPLAASTQKNSEEKHVLTGLMDGSGEYTLVYEDDEGDRMLVGDVPWE
ncbi:hypothetical protein BHM03_00004571 [Ensete ventricosum]|nr:hypothetical protein BHM03_00004571 [Ensete ventricosum]